MTFFTTPELLEIGDMPFSSPNQKPTRNEALEYYRKVAEHYASTSASTRPSIRQRRATAISPSTPPTASAAPSHHRARKLVIATGYYDLPNYLDIPGEDLPKVKHYYHEPHPYFGLDVWSSAAKTPPPSPRSNSGGTARASPSSTAARRCTATSSTGSCPTSTTASRTARSPRTSTAPSRNITEDTRHPRHPAGHAHPAQPFVFALTGYHPDFEFIERLGVKLDAANDRCPVCDPATLESNVPGIYLAGVIVAGERTNEIFIENGRFHGKQIAESLMKSLGKSTETNALILDEVRHIEANLRNQE